MSDDKKGIRMAKKIHVLGMELEAYTVRENMCFLEEYLTSDELNIVCAVSADMLMRACEDKFLHDFISQADLRIIEEAIILEVVEGNYEQQYAQIKKHELEQQCLNFLTRKKKRIYWLGSSQEDLKNFLNYMREHYPEQKVAGSFAECIEGENIENIINEINGADVDVLMLHFHSPSQEQFISNNKQLIHAKLCICVGDGIRGRYESGIRISKIKGLLDQTMFKRKALRYEADNKTDA